MKQFRIPTVQGTFTGLRSRRSGTIRINITIISINTSNAGGGVNISNVDEIGKSSLIWGHEILPSSDNSVVRFEGGIGIGSEETSDLCRRVKQRVLRLVSSSDDGENENPDNKESEAEISYHG
jgi:hypothetical protein